MKMNAALLISIVGILLLTVHANEHGGVKECGKNAEWTECGTACPPTCEIPNPDVCTLQCVIGCQCRKGFLLNKKGECVEPSDCCGENAEWTECGTACPVSCEKPNPDGCTDQCVIGCQCKKGFVLNKKGKCIQPSGCCGKHAEWTECGTACPSTCEHPEPMGCTKQCAIGCQCDKGYVLNKKGECIRPSDCCGH